MTLTGFALYILPPLAVAGVAWGCAWLLLGWYFRLRGDDE
jgi:hypothetical protein